MVSDLLAAIGLTAGAAILVAGLSIAIPAGSAGRVLAATVLAGWFALIAGLGAAGLFDDVRGLGPPALGLAVLLPVAILALGRARPGLLQRAWRGIPLPVLIGLHATRVAGIVMVLWHEAGRLPAPFGPIAGWGDVLVALAAIPVALMVKAGTPGWRPVALGWNALGLLDLVVAIGLGLTSAPGSPLRLFFGEPGTGLMNNLPLLLIPAYLVPLLIVTHLAVFARLRVRLSP
ncbi:hypothetical protein [Inquilinus sp. CA228]|uniref:hypothetical protein n=1 Tax=Inquilinus sp. CA228 TaxID=3455609 RepID=UPI003F8D0E67